jgi:complement component 1 Q subcomponent-binding protein
MNRLVLSSSLLRHHARPRVASCLTMGQQLPSSSSTAALRTNHHLLSTRAAFSSTTTLIDLLKREHAEEVENAATMPPELYDLKALLEKDWKIVDDGAMTRLHKTLESSAKVQVVFHCQDTVEYEEDFNFDDEEEEGEQEEEEEESADPIRFTVTITKAGKTLALTCLTTEELNASIQSAAVTSSALLPEMTLPPGDFQGPEFMELAEDLQEAFHTFLNDDVGVSENVVVFLSMYCDYKEQTQYVQFLEDTKTLLS